MSDAVVKQRASVYTVMLVVSWLCMNIACLFLYFEMNRFEFMTKVPEAIRSKNAATDAEKEANAAPAVEPEMMDPANPMPMDPANPMPMVDPAAPMVDPAAPVAPVDPAAAPMANPAMPADPAAAP